VLNWTSAGALAILSGRSEAKCQGEALTSILISAVLAGSDVSDSDNYSCTGCRKASTLVKDIGTIENIYSHTSTQELVLPPGFIWVSAPVGCVGLGTPALFCIFEDIVVTS